MFEINVKKTIDPDLIGVRTFFTNKISMGLNSGDFICPELENANIRIEIIKDAKPTSAKGTVSKGRPEIKINGKKAGQEFLIKEGDLVQIEKLDFQIIKLLFSADIYDENFFQKAKQTLTGQHHPAVEIINLLEKKLESN